MTSPKLVAQAAALCLIDERVVLVTSKNGKRWVLPKGHLEEDDSSTARRAETEAWEEAGVRGTACPEPIGRYFYQKVGKICYVKVHRLENCGLEEDWPEKSTRRRALYSLAEAMELVCEEALKEILRGVLVR